MERYELKSAGEIRDEELRKRAIDEEWSEERINLEVNMRAAYHAIELGIG